MHFRKKPVVIEASQWHKNGDHPGDYAGDSLGLENGEMRTFTGAERKANDWEGAVVRRFRHPDVPGHKACRECGKEMHVHGWIDTLEGGHNVCPGDWIITGVKGETYPCKPDIFAATYDIVTPAADDAAIEREIQAKGKTAARVTPADLQANIVGEHYFTAAQGACGGSVSAEDRLPGYEALSLLTFCVLVLRNGFTVTGESACASPENFDAEIGRHIARQNAEQKVWPLMGYALKERLWQDSHDGARFPAPVGDLALPLYRCHKVVRAARITGFRGNGNNDAPTLVLGDIAAVAEQSGEWFNKHRPEVGGYYVTYEDGYASFSPAAAFESGYTRV